MPDGLLGYGLGETTSDCAMVLPRRIGRQLPRIFLGNENDEAAFQVHEALQLDEKGAYGWRTPEALRQPSPLEGRGLIGDPVYGRRLRRLKADVSRYR